jgi:hypothetical protein
LKITGEHAYPVSQERLWQALNDHRILARILPGCEALESTGENRLSGRLKIKVGPVQGIFDGTVQLSDIDPPNGYRLQLDGKGAPGFMKGAGSIRLEGLADGSTLLRYDIDAQVGGRIAGVGQRLLDSSAKVITRQGLTGLEAQLAAQLISPPAAEETASPGPVPETKPDPSSSAPFGAPSNAAPSNAVPFAAPADPQPAALPAAPTQAAFARAFLVGLVGELVPRERRWILTVGLALAALIIVAVALRTCV